MPLILHPFFLFFHKPREKRIMELRYLKGKTQMEVAREIGISQAQVSRLEKAALEQFHQMT